METPLDVSDVIGNIGRYHVLLIILRIINALPTPTLISGSWPPSDEFHRGYSHFRELKFQSSPMTYTVKYVTVLLGIILGSTFLGKASDRFGRRPILLICTLVNTLGRFSVFFFPKIDDFFGSRFLFSFLHAGIDLCSSTLLMELCRPRQHSLQVLGSPFGIGIIFLLIPIIPVKLIWIDQPMTIMLTSLISIPILFTLVESPRWLLLYKDSEEAVISIKRIMWFNGRNFPDMNVILPKLQLKPHRSPVDDTGLLGILRSPKLRQSTSMLLVFWFCKSVLFTILFRDRYHIDYQIMAIVIFVFGFLSLQLVTFYGSKRIIKWSLHVVAICCIVLAATNLDRSGSDHNCRYNFFTIFPESLSRFCFIVSIPAACVYTSEVFPTSTRCFGFSVCFAVSMVAAMAVYFLQHLVDQCNAPFFFAAATWTVVTIIFFEGFPETFQMPLSDTVEEAENRACGYKIPELILYFKNRNRKQQIRDDAIILPVPANVVDE